jgi:hypothetical protein
VVLLVSLVIFTVFFPLFPALTRTGLANNLLQVLVKVTPHVPHRGPGLRNHPLGRQTPGQPLAQVLLWPGLATQRLTALEPDDSQIEVALEALKAVLARETSNQSTVDQ